MAPSLTVQVNDLPARQRFAYWWETVARSVVSVDAFSDHAEDFWAEMQLVDLGLVQVSHVRCAAFEARRTPRRIRSSDPGLLQLSLTLSGRSGLHQERREADLRSGDLVLYDTSRPFHAWTGATGTARWPAEGIIMQFPPSALPLPAATVEGLLAVRRPGRTGTGALLLAVLRELANQAASLSPADCIRVSSTLLDLLTMTLTSEAERSGAALHDPERVLVLRLQAFMEQHLADADLSPSAVSSAHHISVRHLHKVFQRQGLSVAEWIRYRRLERCRRDLADPALAATPVNVIAGRWGFTNDSHFSRAFKAAYGQPPATYRRALRVR